MTDPIIDTIAAAIAPYAFSDSAAEIQTRKALAALRSAGYEIVKSGRGGCKERSDA